MNNGITQKRVNNHLFMQEITRLFRDQGKKSVTFVVRGFSMRPFLEDGRDKVILAPPREPEIGDVVLAEVREQTYALHRVIKIEDRTYTMRGDGNPLRMTEEFTYEKIIGVADGFVRKGKTVSTDSRKWRWYSATWNALKPLRRILLAIYRRI
ncbi:MAG: S24/S26 family peptidase [Bacteroidaceae bacterium]|nr:S24/S26 family peptidase [Bacteroidaceae bacterium]